MAVIKDNIRKLINYRIEQEELSSRLYKAMGICMTYKGFTGAGKLLDKWSKEESLHAEKAYNYLLDLDIRPEVPALAYVDKEFGDLPDVVKATYDHEVLITKQCNDLAIAAQKESDYMTLELAQWYLKEQVEELNKTCALLDRIEILGGKNITREALYLLDKELEELAA